MAMTTCPECGKPVSSQAVRCPSCAYPLSKVSEEFKRIQLLSGLMALIGVGLLIGGSPGVGGLFLLIGVAAYLSARIAIWWHRK